MLPSGSGKNPQFFCVCRKSQKIKNGGEFFFPVRKMRNVFVFFRREIGNQTNSQPILYLGPILNQFSMPKLFLQPFLYLGKNDSLFKPPNLNQKKAPKNGVDGMHQKTSDRNDEKPLSTSRNIVFSIKGPLWTVSLTKSICVSSPFHLKVVNF